MTSVIAPKPEAATVAEVDEANPSLESSSEQHVLLGTLEPFSLADDDITGADGRFRFFPRFDDVTAYSLPSVGATSLDATDADEQEADESARCSAGAERRCDVDFAVGRLFVVRMQSAEQGSKSRGTLGCFRDAQMGGILLTEVRIMRCTHPVVVSEVVRLARTTHRAASSRT